MTKFYVALGMVTSFAFVGSMFGSQMIEPDAQEAEVPTLECPAQVVKIVDAASAQGIQFRDGSEARCKEWCSFHYKNLQPASFTLNSGECHCVRIETTGETGDRTNWTLTSRWSMPDFKVLSEEHSKSCPKK